MKRQFVFVLFLALLARQCAASSAQTRPNLVFILADDLGNADVGWHGSEIKTPHLDQLAASGAKLEHFYVLPVCTPTRAAFITGRYPIRYGLQLNVLREGSRYGLPLAERTLPQVLREAGYTTALCGKWHLGDFDRAYWPNQRGFDHAYGPLGGVVDYVTHQSFGRGAKPDWYRNGEPVQEAGYATNLLADEAAAVIRRQPANKPLFLYVAFTAVHGPLQPPDRESVAAYETAMPGQRAILAAMTTVLDQGCGKILAALEASGRRENTLVVFASDNGGLPPGRNLPYRGFKSSLYEGGVRSCALANWPGRIRPGTVVTEPIHMVDWFPTFVGIAGGATVQESPLDGRDIWPTIADGAASPHEHILLNSTPREGALRRGDWKLVINGRDIVSESRDVETGVRKQAGGDAGKSKTQGRTQKVELFNLRQDPGETRDQAAAQPDIVRELRELYAAYDRAAVMPLQLQKK